MTSASFVAPAVQVARAFMDLDAPVAGRKREYEASQRRIGIDKELWFLASGSWGGEFVAYMESSDFNKALGMFVESRDEFDLWFKERLANATGVDLNNPPEIKLPELLSSYEA